MKKLFSVVVAAAFAAASAGAFAQKDVTTKEGGKTNASTKGMKDKPKAKPVSMPKSGPGKPKEKGSTVTTKRGEAVTTKEGKEATNAKK